MGLSLLVTRVGERREVAGRLHSLARYEMVGEGARDPGLSRTASPVGSRNQIPNLEDGEIVFYCAV